MIDVCEYCGTFQRVALEDIRDNGDVVTICSECAKMFDPVNEETEEDDKDTKYVDPDKFKWLYVV